jgi:2-octaprenyl-6-methoxyphenol hydroxylase
LKNLGANISNAALNFALHARTCSSDRIQWLPTSAVVGLEIGESFVSIELAEGNRLKAKLAVAADGRNSIARAAAGIATRSWRYDQAAIAATFRHARPHANITTELHRRAGPLTTVPLPGDASSLVWVEAPGEVQRLAALDDRSFLAELSARLQGLLGQLSEITPRATYPLTGLGALRMGRNSVALVGESAHVIPPIGAQGLNLGLRDAASLAECVAAASAHGLDIGSPETLEAYHASRATDVLSRAVSVDLLNRSLLTDFLPVQALRGLGLHILANVGPVRRLLMQGGLSAPGALPRLMQPGTLRQPLDAGTVAGQVRPL